MPPGHVYATTLIITLSTFEHFALLRKALVHRLTLLDVMSIFLREFSLVYGRRGATFVEHAWLSHALVRSTERAQV